MMFGTTSLAVLLAVLPVVWTLPTNLSTRQFTIPTCAAEQALAPTDGLFDACLPSDLACLCTLDQYEVTRYVTLVQPWIDGEAGSEECTPGARYQYKDLLLTVCALPTFNKVVEWAPVPSDDLN